MGLGQTLSHNSFILWKQERKANSYNQTQSKAKQIYFNNKTVDTHCSMEISLLLVGYYYVFSTIEQNNTSLHRCSGINLVLSGWIRKKKNIFYK